jgi:peroxiredoxin
VSPFAKFLVVGCAVLMLSTGWTATADEKEKPASSQAATKPSDADVDLFKVPDGTPDELLAFIKKLETSRPPASETYDEKVAFLKQARRAANSAADKILAAKPADALAVRALTAKFGALRTLQQLGDNSAGKQLEELADKYRADPRPEFANVALRFHLMQRLRSQLHEAPAADEAQAIADDIRRLLAAGPATREDVALVIMAAGNLEAVKQPQKAIELYLAGAKAMSGSQDKDMARYALKFAGAARLLGLVGQPIELHGKLLGGETFDWAAYRGKVVLVDFWSTWCGPCVGELPNLKRNYEQYHDRGFDVVGISLDDDRNNLQKFVADRKIPWPILFEDSGDASGWNHPMATYYGIMAIPTTILVDRQGKVITLDARGEALGEQLAKLLGPARPEEKGAADDEKPKK